jgi:hypothetical protein
MLTAGRLRVQQVMPRETTAPATVHYIRSGMRFACFRSEISGSARSALNLPLLQSFRMNGQLVQPLYPSVRVVCMCLRSSFEQGPSYAHVNFLTPLATKVVAHILRIISAPQLSSSASAALYHSIWLLLGTIWRCKRVADTRA